MNLIESITIDSLKIRIDLDHIVVINEDLLTHWGEISEHGECSPTLFKKKRLTIKENGITTSYLIQQRTVNKHISKDCLIVMFNSKLLREDYLDGITPENIEKVYKHIITQKVVSIPYDTFLSAAVTDLDLKKDFQLESREQQVKHFEFFRDMTKPTQSKAGGYDMRKEIGNLGIQWTKREAATSGKPFVKMYAKDIELRYNSNEFYLAYMEEIELSSIVRYEVTIKNKNHFNQLMKSKVDDHINFDLRTVLNLKDSDKKRMMQDMFRKHLMHQVIESKEESKNETMSQFFARQWLKNTGSITQCEIIIDSEGYDKHQRQRLKKVLRDIWHNRINKSVKTTCTVSDKAIDFIFKTNDEYEQIYKQYETKITSTRAIGPANEY